VLERMPVETVGNYVRKCVSSNNLTYGHNPSNHICIDCCIKDSRRWKCNPSVEDKASDSINE